MTRFLRAPGYDRRFAAPAPRRAGSLLLPCLLFLCLFVAPRAAAAAEKNTDAGAVYTGSAACKQCHAREYENFIRYSKKARSQESVKQMRAKLTREELEGCYNCHTTGHGKKGGFTDYERTPQLGDVGCETCHGPGSIHADSGDPSDIQRKPDVDGCLACHSAERIKEFNFRPLRYSGAH